MIGLNEILERKLTFRDVLHLLHLSIPALIIVLPFLPRNILKKVWWLPIIVYINWIIFDGCFVTKITHPDEENEMGYTFVTNILRNVFPTISNKQANWLCNLVISGSMALSAAILLRECNLESSQLVDSIQELAKESYTRITT